VIERLRGHEEVPLAVERLPLGDYLIDEVLPIERKTLPDLVHLDQGRTPVRSGLPVGRLAALEGVHCFNNFSARSAS